MNTNNNRQIFRSGLMYIMIFVAIVGLVSWFNQGSNGQTTEVSYTQFVQELKKGDIKEIKMQYANSVYTITGEYKEAKENTNTSSKGLAIFDKRTSKTSNFKTTVLPNDGTVTEINNAAQQAGTQITTLPESQSGIWLSLFLQLVVPLGIFGFLMFNLLSSQMGQGGPRGVMNFGRSKATDQNKQKVKVRFSARIPAGVLLEGPPGTGKTLLAKAVAGEANVPFFSISGSEFVEMFVGVGASRVRDLFENAKKNAPAIIFIDEIDAVGRQRGTGMGGGHDEREQTLNQLLVEMDGFEGTEGVIVIAATNRSDVLDPALLRPGRFDRQILVGRPDVKGREAILKVHARNKKLAKEVDLKVIAQQTPGFSGAELENLLNEAALVAARRDKTAIDKLDVDEAHDRVIAGPAKKDRAISEKERKMVAFHEAGHTIVGMVLSDARVVHKVTIVPRGRAGGYAIMLPKEDRFLMTKKELFEQVVGLLGGRAAEEFIFNEKTTGASNDFEQATGIVRSMITEYGMYDELGTVQYEGNHQVFIGRDYGQTKAYSDQVAFEIDNAVRSIMKEAYAQALQILEEHKDQLTLIAEKLLELETLDERTIKALFETGEMPTEDVEEEYPSEAEAASFEEAKKALAKREASKQDDSEEESDSNSDSEQE